MTIRIQAIALITVFFITGCGRGSEKVITGRFLLFERLKDIDALDTIDFRSDGSCIVDSGDRTGIQGKYHANSDGSLTIEANTGTQTKYTCNYQLQNYTLILSNKDNPSLYYVRLPEGPRPQFGEIVGIFYSHTDLGDSAGEITPDRKFRDHLHNLVPQERTYYDIYVDGNCSYSNGVVTYVPERSNTAEYKYLRDFIVKRDRNGLWIVDPFHDTLLCETLATNLDLPPPPEGYRKREEP